MQQTTSTKYGTVYFCTFGFHTYITVKIIMLIKSPSNLNFEHFLFHSKIILGSCHDFYYKLNGKVLVLVRTENKGSL